ncbi:MAG: LPS-assembly protein LptD [Flavobacteriaceae bacterium]|nr:LPS-assembly protein LptD [Flavobacteriaceae bacterium]
MGNTELLSQDIPPKNEIEIPANKQQDSVSLNIKPIINPELNEIVLDSVKTDSIQPKEELLTEVMDYYGEEYVYMNKKEHKVYMYDKAYITYQDMKIEAGYIILDYSKNEIYARGIDSAGVYSQLPIFTQAGTVVVPDSIRFNMDTKKALIYNSRSGEGELNYKAEVTKRVNDSVYFLKNIKFTTSKDIDNPEYYFYTRRAKVVPNKKIVTGFTNMYIADVPLPLGLPFAFFPLTKDRTSGFIIPSFGDNNARGFFFQNGGYYFAINDYIDLTVLGDYYTNGSYAIRGESSYALRYKFNGNLSIRFEKLINSERGFDDFSESSVYNIRWNHNQDSKANPSSRFSASVNLGSSRFFQQSINQTNNASALVNTLSSSISYSKAFETVPQVNISVAATHSQNTNTQEINMSLPNVNASVARIFPFEPKVGSKKGIIDNINFQYNLATENRIRTTDSLFFKPEMFESAQIGAQHTIPISTNFKILKYLSASMGTSYKETWVFKTISKEYDQDYQDGLGGVVEDTINGFESYRTYNFSTSLGTTLYGMFNFGKGKKIQALRHVFRPSLSYSINPSFDQFWDQYENPIDDNGNTETVYYSRFEKSLYGAPGRVRSSNVGISMSNTIEAKVRDRDTTATSPKKIVLLNNLNFSTAYNIAGDSLNWSPLQFTGSIPIVKKLDFNFNGTLDPYALDNSNIRIDEFNINNDGSLFRLTRANISINYSFSSRDFKGKKDDDEDFDSETFRNGGRPDDLFGDSTLINDSSNFEDDYETSKSDFDWYNFTIPWDFRMAYTITYNNTQRQNEISSQSLMFSSNIEFSPKWKVGVSSGYDFKNNGITLTQFRFQRDLESWRLSFNWTPIGATNTSWYMFIGIKSSMLSDIKYEKRREPNIRL